MWPASSSVTWTPCATSCSAPYGIGLSSGRVRSTSSSVYSGSRGPAPRSGPPRAAAPRGRGRRGSRRPPPPARRPRRTPPVAGGVLGRAVRVAPLPAGRPLRELLLELRRVEEHEPGQLGGGRRAHDRAPEALLDQQREQPAVVEVGVGEDDGVERRRVHAQRHPVAHRLVGAALEHPAVDEDPRVARVDEVARARHGPGAAEEGELHAADRDTRPARRACWLCEPCRVTPESRLAALEAAYLEAREARDRLDVARGDRRAGGRRRRSRPRPARRAALRERLGASDAAPGAVARRRRRERSTATTPARSRRSAPGIEPRGADGAAGGPGGRRGRLRRRRRLARGHRRRRRGAPGAARGLLRAPRGRARVRRRDA